MSTLMQFLFVKSGVISRLVCHATARTLMHNDSTNTWAGVCTMGPSHTTRPKATIRSNLQGTDGFFIRGRSLRRDPDVLGQAVFARCGFVPVPKHEIQGHHESTARRYTYLLNAGERPDTLPTFVEETSGPYAPAMRLACVDAQHALKRAVDSGAKESPVT